MKKIDRKSVDWILITGIFGLGIIVGYFFKSEKLFRLKNKLKDLLQ